ncbi:zinc chelation protein SecC [Salinicola aestuarinus]|uniref:zinc chelation protein SecC n=1 Tax=Salinicola aestuarinus TaxID=1949082 RepID=UPI001300B203|nr:zinc chelation protein SecC [Salinicola aestuarinus]
MKVPDISKPYVRRFCESVVPRARPERVKHQPLVDAEAAECFRVVEAHVAANGGEAVIGWAIWEWRKVMIEAEFHAVWRDPNGKLLDLTPQGFKPPRILFVPDPQRQYEGVQVNNIRRPLREDERITRYIDLWQQRFELLNEGDLANQHGLVGVSELRLGEIEDAMYQTRRSLALDFGPG